MCVCVLLINILSCLGNYSRVVLSCILCCLVFLYALFCDLCYYHLYIPCGDGSVVSSSLALLLLLLSCVCGLVLIFSSVTSVLCLLPSVTVNCISLDFVR
jgi:hypothetical protein